MKAKRFLTAVSRRAMAVLLSGSLSACAAPAGVTMSGPGSEEPLRQPETPVARPVAPAYAQGAAPGPVTGTAFVERHCAACHAGGKNKGKFTVDAILAKPMAVEHQDIWTKIVARVTERDMPPEDEPQPSDAERQHLAAWVDEHVLRLDCTKPDPGFVIAHRLNRAEYRNTTRDLFGVDVDVSHYLPADHSGRGFDNMAATLSLSPFLLERYLVAADALLDAVVFEPGRRYRRRLRLPADAAELHHDARLQGGGRVLLRNDQDIALSVNLPIPARYSLTLTVGTWFTPPAAAPTTSPAPGASVTPGFTAPPGGPPPLELVFLVDDEEQATFEVRSSQPKPVTVTLHVPPGPHRIRALPRPVRGAPPVPGAKAGDNPKPAPVEAAVTQIALDGPLEAPSGPGAPHQALFFVHPKSARDAIASRAILERFASRAFRRPVTAEVVDRLQAVVDAAWKRGAGFERGVREGLRAVLVSPRFLYRIARAGGQGEGQNTLDEHALAERLSYFLWSTMPDRELRDLADAGLLREQLGAQIRRMLYDARARALVENFAGQWLQFRLVDDVAPAWFAYRTFTEELRSAFREETARLFEHVMREDKSVLELLTADYTFVNDVLARHYGIEGVTGPAFRRVSLADLPRRGVLTHASTLTITSRSTRTSPVMRGKWVLDTLLGTPPPPPPPDVPELPDDNGASRRSLQGTLRARLQAHRDNPACSPCHARMDPIGFGLENFDGIGAYRETDNNAPIDSAGELPDGESFRGPIELVNLLAEKKRDLFVRTFATQLLVYALGRDLRPVDRCSVDAILARAEKNGFSFSSFVFGIVDSVPFQKADPARADGHTFATGGRGDSSATEGASL